MALPAQEPFTGATANLVDPPWALFATILKKDGSGRGTLTSSSLDCLETWDSDAFANDQYSQYVVKFTGSVGQYIYLVARVTGASVAAGTFYWFWSDGASDTALLKSVTNVATTLATANATAFVSGDLFKLICNGTAISVTQNGSTILSATDSAATTGSAGMGGSGTIGTVLFDDWEGNNVSGGPVAALVDIIGHGMIPIPRL